MSKYQKVVQLGKLQQSKVRKCRKRWRNMASVLDIINPLTVVKQQVWCRLKATSRLLTNGVRNHQFSDGKCSKANPVAGGDILDSVELPGSKAKEFSSAAI
jgi:hypothetical protein